MKFFVWLNEQQQRPFDEETIQRMVSEGQITHETLLCAENGDLKWTPAKELFPQDSSSQSFVPPKLMTIRFVQFVGNPLRITLTSNQAQIFEHNYFARLNFFFPCAFRGSIFPAMIQYFDLLRHVLERKSA